MKSEELRIFLRIETARFLIPNIYTTANNELGDVQFLIPHFQFISYLYKKHTAMNILGGSKMKVKKFNYQPQHYKPKDEVRENRKQELALEKDTSIEGVKHRISGLSLIHI